MIFSIYNNAEGETALYTYTKDVSVNNGILTVVIGEGYGRIPKEVFTQNNQLYIGVKIGENTEMRPRQRINSE